MLHRSRTTPLLWALALVTGLVTARAVGAGLAELDARAEVLGPPVTVVVAAVDLAAGATVTGTSVRPALAPRSLVPDGATGDVADLVGRTVVLPLPAGAVVTDRHVGDGLAAAVPPGHRVVRLVADGSVRPEPGAVVDVVGPGAHLFDGGTGPEVVGALTVLAVEADPVAADAVAVLVLVPADEAPRLAAMAASGPVALALAPAAAERQRPPTPR